MTIEAPFRKSVHLPLLTAEQEISLSCQVQEYLPYKGLGDKARADLRVSLLANGQNRWPDDQEVVVSLFAQARTEVDLKVVHTIARGLSAVDTFVERNQGLVRRFADRYQGKGVDHEDLIQEGNVGLLLAVYKFDPGRGIRFSTYASFWIKQKIKLVLKDHGRIIRVPVFMQEDIRGLNETHRELQEETGREPSDEELAERFRDRDHQAVPVERIQEIWAAQKTVISLDQEIDPANPNQKLADTVGDPNSLSPEKEVLRIDLRDRLQEILNSLPPREKRVLTLRYGLGDDRDRTLEEVGAEIGVTRERVRQLENQGLRRMRHPDMAKRYSNYRGDSLDLV